MAIQRCVSIKYAGVFSFQMSFVKYNHFVYINLNDLHAFTEASLWTIENRDDGFNVSRLFDYKDLPPLSVIYASLNTSLTSQFAPYLDCRFIESYLIKLTVPFVRMDTISRISYPILNDVNKVFDKKFSAHIQACEVKFLRSDTLLNQDLASL